MTPADPAAPAANVLLTEIGAFKLTVLASVIVSGVTLCLAGPQRAKQEKQAGNGSQDGRSALGAVP